MSLPDEDQRRKKFIDILLNLSTSFEYLKDNKVLKDVITQLEELYIISWEEEKFFRHYYSDIFSVIPIIIKDKKIDRLAALAYNVFYLKEQYSLLKKEKNNITKQLNKLFDHITLEYARVNNNIYEGWRDSQEEAINRVENKVNGVEEILKTQKLDSEEVKSKLNNIQKEYVGILSIFAAVIIAFTAGTAFSSSMLNNISEISIYRLIFTCLLLGCVLINVLYVLFSFIHIIVKGKMLEITVCVLSNIIIALLLFCTYIAWCNGFVETRNGSFFTKENPNNIEHNLKLHDISRNFNIKGIIETAPEK